MTRRAFETTTDTPDRPTRASDRKWAGVEGAGKGVAAWDQVATVDELRRARGEQHHAAGEGRQMNKFFKALSDETRRSILRLLEERAYSVNEIVGNFRLSQPTISRHLSVLKEANLVVDQRRGQQVIYQLNSPVLAEAARQFFSDFRGCCQDFG